jgi:hypothetical protein
MCFFKNLTQLIDGISKSDVARGMLLQATNDIFIHRTDREKGYTEVKFANEGDDLMVLSEDTENPGGGFRVMNCDNHDQIETVQLTDMDSVFGGEL